MASCTALGCTNRRAKKMGGITFHRFPKDKKRRQLWIQALGRDESWVPSDHNRLCSLHFPQEMIDRTSSVKARLRENAVPSIFANFTKYHRQKLGMDEKAAGNVHIVRVVPIASENNRESEKDDESENEPMCITENSKGEVSESDVTKDEESDVSKDEESDVSERAESDVSKSEESDVDVAEEKITEKERNYPLTEENGIEKIPDTEFVTYLVCEPNQQLPNLSQDHSVELTNNFHMENRSQMKDIISNVFQTESQVQAGEGNKRRELLFKLSLLENKLGKLHTEREKDRKKIRRLCQSQRRSMKRIETLKENIAVLQQKLYLAQKNSEILEAASPLLLELLSTLRSTHNSGYSVEAREFIKNLYTISPSAYRYIRSYLILSLPHDRTVAKWKASDNSALNGEDSSTSNDIDIQSFVHEDAEHGNVNSQENDMQTTDTSVFSLVIDSHL